MGVDTMKRRYYLDTEFIEYPCSIELISIGIVCEDGRTLYLISSQFDESLASEWVKKNVISKLDYAAAPYLAMTDIKRRIIEFIGYDEPEFWGYCADYDWVVFCWIFGRMSALPEGFPMYCRDLKQLSDDLGNPELPKKGDGDRDALEYAKWNKEVHAFLEWFRDAGVIEGNGRA